MLYDGLQVESSLTRGSGLAEDCRRDGGHTSQYGGWQLGRENVLRHCDDLIRELPEAADGELYVSAPALLYSSPLISHIQYIVLETGWGLTKAVPAATFPVVAPA